MNHKESGNTYCVREKFLNFFENRGHKKFNSFSLIPVGDPTLLFTSAGMVPFKDYFLGKKKDLNRAVSYQKCLRTGDIDSVGKTPFHHTFFEMLGNFSFGDYFKKEAIAWGWEFLTKEIGLDKSRLHISVYKEDEESYNIWANIINIPKEKIYKLSEDTNFWPANAPKLGPNGPCGPCSEIYYDRGEKYCPKGKNCDLVVCNGLPNQKCYRCVEIWNLVFTQYNRIDIDKLEQLPQKNIDTGMGFERLLCIVEDVETNFDTSLFKNGWKSIRKEMAFDERDPDVSFKEHRISISKILDHSRAVTFAISDGIVPSNVGRGYVTRKLLRRAMVEAYFMKNKYTPFMYKLADVWRDEYDSIYDNLKTNLTKIHMYIKNEEEKFASQISVFQKYINDILMKSGSYISGEDIFQLYDTYGVSLDIIKILAKGIKEVDEEGFNKLLEEQRKRSRQKSKLIGDVFISTGSTYGERVSPQSIVQSTINFVGYEKLQSESTVKAIIVDKEPLEYLDSTNKEFIIIIDPTPFYGEEGGQMGDTGKIIQVAPGAKIASMSSNYAEIDVLDTKKDDDLIYSICKLTKGKISLYDKVTAIVDREKRFNTARNHTGTHILHSFLRHLLGNHVQQAGSLVAPFKLRFDFTHPKKLTLEELQTLESYVNKKILENCNVHIEEKELETAKKEGAIAFFGEKYKDRVRVVTIGDFSKELCGGTHLTQTGLIGFLKIIDEVSIASGVRRIEAITGEEAIKSAFNDVKIMKKISQLLESPTDKILERLDKLLQTNLVLQKELTKYKIKDTLNMWETVLSNDKNIININNFLFASLHYKESEGSTAVSAVPTDVIEKDLINNVSSLMSKYKIDILFIISSVGQTAVPAEYIKVSLVINNNLKTKGYNAGKILKEFLSKVGGSGGGSPTLAKGVVKNILSTTLLQKEFIHYLQKTLINNN